MWWRRPSDGWKSCVLQRPPHRMWSSAVGSSRDHWRHPRAALPPPTSSRKPTSTHGPRPLDPPTDFARFRKNRLSMSSRDNTSRSRGGYANGYGTEGYRSGSSGGAGSYGGYDYVKDRSGSSGSGYGESGYGGLSYGDSRRQRDRTPSDEVQEDVSSYLGYGSERTTNVSTPSRGYGGDMEGYEHYSGRERSRPRRDRSQSRDRHREQEKEQSKGRAVQRADRGRYGVGTRKLDGMICPC